MARREIVSSSNEELILVDEQDREIGCKSKSDCHIGNGILHRAFSIFIFNTNNEVLIQKRSSEKLLWPSCWSNACCSHPRYGEPMKTAVVRRLVQELGFNCPLIFLYKFQYHAQYGDGGAEHEFCWVYYGLFGGKVDANSKEVADWRFLGISELEAALAKQPQQFTPWFKMEWAHIRSNHLGTILRPPTG